MNCPHCNTELVGVTPFCPFCGEKLDFTDTAVTEETQAPAEQAKTTIENDEDSFSQKPVGQLFDPLHPPFPMKWYKWLIYFALWFGGILNILYSFSYFTGSHFLSEGYTSDQISLIYQYLPALQVVDILFGISLVLSGVFSIYVRFALKNYKSSAPRLLTALYCFEMIAILIYNLANYLIFTANGITVELAYYFGYAIGQLIVLIPFLICNYHYFKRRKSLFVN